MLVNETQKQAHAEVLSNLNVKAREYIMAVDDAHASPVDVYVQRDRLHDAIEALQLLNELMNHTADENEHLKDAIEAWKNADKDAYHAVENIIYHTEEDTETEEDG